MGPYILFDRRTYKSLAFGFPQTKNNPPLFNHVFRQPSKKSPSQSRHGKSQLRLPQRPPPPQPQQQPLPLFLLGSNNSSRRQSYLPFPSRRQPLRPHQRSPVLRPLQKLLSRPLAHLLRLTSSKRKVKSIKQRPKLTKRKQASLPSLKQKSEALKMKSAGSSAVIRPLRGRRMTSRSKPLKQLQPQCHINL